MEYDGEKMSEIINNETNDNEFNKQDPSINSSIENNDIQKNQQNYESIPSSFIENSESKPIVPPKSKNIPNRRSFNLVRSNSLSSPRRELPPIPINNEGNKSSSALLIPESNKEKKADSLIIRTNFSSSPKQDFMRSSSPKRPVMRFGMRNSSSSLSIKSKTPLPPLPSPDSQQNIPLLQPLPVQLEEEKRRQDEEYHTNNEEESNDDQKEQNNSNINLVLPPPPPPLHIDNLEIVSKEEENNEDREINKETSVKDNDEEDNENSQSEENNYEPSKEEKRPSINSQQQSRSINKTMNNKLSNRWVINQHVNIQPTADDEDDDWEDKLKLELERKWKESDGSEGPIMLTTIRQTIKKIWVRPLEKLPLQTDLPRLVNGLEIVDETSGTMVCLDELILNHII